MSGQGEAKAIKAARRITESVDWARPVLEAFSDDIRRAIDKKYHGNERVRVLAELESMENTLREKYRRFDEMLTV